MSVSKLFDKTVMYGSYIEGFCAGCAELILDDCWCEINCLSCLEYAHEILDDEWTTAINTGVQDQYKDHYLEQLTLVRYAQVEAMKKKLKEHNIN